MDVLIVIKWLTNYTGHTDQAPSIITTMVGMFLGGGEIKGQPFLPANQFIENILVLVSLICIPWMLLVKPWLLWQEYAAKAKDNRGGDYEMNNLGNNAIQNYEVFNDEKQNAAGYGDPNFDENQNPRQVDEALFKICGKGRDDKPGFDVAEVAVHQLVETIEFVLGAVSNTASYLRLWALSLAHSQLSKVFYDMLLGGAIESGSTFRIFFGYLIWATATFGIMLCMDLLECFLHTLRLHWVEFMGKFFKGEGYAYSSMNFKASLEVDEGI